jgi:hypothetical protein
MSRTAPLSQMAEPLKQGHNLRAESCCSWALFSEGACQHIQLGPRGAVRLQCGCLLVPVHRALADAELRFDICASTPFFRRRLSPQYLSTVYLRGTAIQSHHLEARVVIELPHQIFPIEKIGTDGCLCGLPGCQGHPVISGDREFVEFTADEYDYLLGDLHRRMRTAAITAAPAKDV